MRSRSPSRERAVTCECGVVFRARHSQAKYCSATCARNGERATWRAYGSRNADYRRVYRARYYRANRARLLEKSRRYRLTASGRRAAQRNSSRQRAKYPERYHARQAVMIAIRAGWLRKEPCRRCGARRTEAHHEDYSRPLEVTWLCRPCHDIVGGRSALAGAA